MMNIYNSVEDEYDRTTSRRREQILEKIKNSEIEPLNLKNCRCGSGNVSTIIDHHFLFTKSFSLCIHCFDCGFTFSVSGESEFNRLFRMAESYWNSSWRRFLYKIGVLREYKDVTIKMNVPYGHKWDRGVMNVIYYDQYKNKDLFYEMIDGGL